MSNWTENLHIPSSAVGPDQGTEARRLQEAPSTGAEDTFSDPPPDFNRLMKFSLEDDHASEAIETINSLKARRERLVAELLESAKEVSAIDAAITLVAKVNME